MIEENYSVNLTTEPRSPDSMLSVCCHATAVPGSDFISENGSIQVDAPLPSSCWDEAQGGWSTNSASNSAARFMPFSN
jgi:hypothetical protein